MFAIGLGSDIDVNELSDVATDPDCTHVFLVQDFSKIEDLKQQMQEATCKTKIQVPEINGKSNLSITREVSCELQVGNSCEITTKTYTSHVSSTENFMTKVNCGNATLYASYNNPNPGVAYYEIKSVTTHGNAGKTDLLLEDGKTVRITVEGHPFRLGFNSANGNIFCEAMETVVPAHKVSWEFPNPCTRKNLLDGQLNFPHPHYLDKYVMCDFTGKVYVVQCPKGHMYNHVTQTCGLGTGTSWSINGTRVPLGSDLTNPCTVEAILAGHMLFPHPHDNTKFIICDVWGKAWVSDCPESYIWKPKDSHCEAESSMGHLQGPSVTVV
ncbi:uncharacterized protein LOC135480975 [Liolophura sinensis]|uniref:uncharacterized protein LOC135480975 n=1 Tax=Liolophura sinensis TaxID=3198878 RepID=UPI0031591B11